MPRYRYRIHDDDDTSSTLLFVAAGAVVGLVAGLFVAQRFGGVAALTSRVRDRVRRGRGAEAAAGVDEDEVEDTDVDDVPDEELEERVLEAFNNDPILSERAIDIGAIGEGVIELSGSVWTEDEVAHATTVAGGVPGVETVVNRLDVGAQDVELENTRRRHAEGDPSLTESGWEGMGVGTGRRRQGTSAEVDRHADPKPELEERWQRTDRAVREAADDVDALSGTARRTPRRPPRGDRIGGAPVSPSGVPKADHVVEPVELKEPDRAD